MNFDPQHNAPVQGAPSRGVKISSKRQLRIVPKLIWRLLDGLNTQRKRRSSLLGGIPTALVNSSE